MYTHAYIIYIFILHLYSSVDGNLGCLQILHIVNNAHSRLLSCLSSEKMSASTGLCVLKLSINLVWGGNNYFPSHYCCYSLCIEKKKKKQQKEAGKEWGEGTDVWRKDEKREKKNQRM